MLAQLLPGYTSPETAYVVDDYPYSFRLRCTIRYWMEYKKNHGYRLVSQTGNPKKPGLVWNKPKASTYATFGVMGLDEQGHVQWMSISYANLKEAIAFRDTYQEGMDELQKLNIRNYIAYAVAYEARKAALQAEGREIFTITTSDPVRVV